MTQLSELTLLIGQDQKLGPPLLCRSLALARGRSHNIQACTFGNGVIPHGWLLRELSSLRSTRVDPREVASDLGRLKAALTPWALWHLAGIRVVCAPSATRQYRWLRGESVRVVATEQDGQRVWVELSCAQSVREGFEAVLHAFRSIDRSDVSGVSRSSQDSMLNRMEVANEFPQDEPLSWREWDCWLKSNHTDVRASSRFEEAFVDRALTCGSRDFPERCAQSRKDLLDYFASRGCVIDRFFHPQCGGGAAVPGPGISNDAWLGLFQAALTRIQDTHIYKEGDESSAVDLSQFPAASWQRARTLAGEGRFLMKSDGPMTEAVQVRGTCGDDQGCSYAKLQIARLLVQKRLPGCYRLDPQSQPGDWRLIQVGDWECQ